MQLTNISYRIIKRKKANWTGHILCRNCLVTQLMEEEVTGRRRRRWKQLLNDLKKGTGN